MLATRLRTQFEEYRRQEAEAAKARAAEAEKKAAELAAYRQRLKDAGITSEGLVELIDASERFDPAPIAAKLAEIAVEGRQLRIYETSDPNLLLVKEKRGPLPLDDYAIERDEGLAADLKLFAQLRDTAAFVRLAARPFGSSRVRSDRAGDTLREAGLQKRTRPFPNAAEVPGAALGAKRVAHFPQHSAGPIIFVLHFDPMMPERSLQSTPSQHHTRRLQPRWDRSLEGMRLPARDPRAAAGNHAAQTIPNQDETRIVQDR